MILYSIILFIKNLQRYTYFQMLNQIIGNKLISRILHVKIIIAFSLIHTIKAEWLSYAYLSTYIPAHTYSIYCTRNSRISGNVTWSGSSDLDVYAYAEGSDLFSSSALIKFWSITPGI